MDVALTGGTGFVGRHTARALLDAGHRVRLLARDPARVPSELQGRVVVFEGDVTSAATLPPFLASADHVVHMAAVVGAGGLTIDAYRAVHVTGTRHLVAAAAQAGVRRVVHVSSVGIYGDTGPGAADESTPARPQDPYEQSKWEGEGAARAAARATGLPLVVLRPAGVYGRWDRRLLKLFRGLARGRFVMIGPGTCRYHLVHVDDVVQAVTLALDHPAAAGEDFIVAGAEATVLRDVVAQAAAVAGRTPPRISIPLAPVMLLARMVRAACKPFGVAPPLYPERVAFFTKERAYSIGKARRVLGYEPLVDLASGLRRTFDEYRADGWL